MKRLQLKETEDASESSTCRKSRRDRPSGRENRGRGEGRHARPRASGKDRSGGRGRHAGTGSPPANLTRPRAASLPLAFGGSVAGHLVDTDGQRKDECV